MKLLTTGLDHLNLEVIDLEESVKFYNELFEFEVRQDQPDEHSKIIGNDHVKLALYESPGFDGFEKKGFHHFGLHIENFDAILQKCTEMNIPIEYGGPIKWEHSTSIYILDPNGYEIELTEVSGGGI